MGQIPASGGNLDTILTSTNVQDPLYTVYCPLRRVVEENEQETICYIVELNADKLGLTCNAMIHKKSGGEETKPYPIEEFFSKYDPKFLSKLKRLEEYDKEEIFEEGHIADILKISEPALNTYLREYRPEIRQETKTHGLKLWAVYVLLCDLMPFTWSKSTDVAKMGNVKSELIENTVSTGEYEALRYKTEWRISKFGEDKLIFDMLEREDTISINNETLYSTPHVASVAFKEYGKQDNLTKRDYTLMYNWVFANCYAEDPAKRGLESEIRGARRYVTKTTMENLLNTMTIEKACEVLQIGREELIKQADRVPFDYHTRNYVSRDCVNRMKSMPKISDDKPIIKPDEYIAAPVEGLTTTPMQKSVEVIPQRTPDEYRAIILRDLDYLTQNVGFDQAEFIEALKWFKGELEQKCNDPDFAKAYELIVRELHSPGSVDFNLLSQNLKPLLKPSSPST